MPPRDACLARPRSGPSAPERISDDPPQQNEGRSGRESQERAPRIRSERLAGQHARVQAWKSEIEQRLLLAVPGSGTRARGPVPGAVVRPRLGRPRTPGAARAGANPDQGSELL